MHPKQDLTKAVIQGPGRPPKPCVLRLLGSMWNDFETNRRLRHPKDYIHLLLHDWDPPASRESAKAIVYREVHRIQNYLRSQGESIQSVVGPGVGAPGPGTMAVRKQLRQDALSGSLQPPAAYQQIYLDAMPESSRAHARRAVSVQLRWIRQQSPDLEEQSVKGRPPALVKMVLESLVEKDHAAGETPQPARYVTVLRRLFPELGGDHIDGLIRDALERGRDPDQ